MLVAGRIFGGESIGILTRPLVLVAGLTALGAAIRWPSIAGASFWYDEWVTKSLLKASAIRLLPDIKGSESTPPLYYVLAWSWAHLFGSSVVALRSLSWAFGVATIPVAYAAAHALASRRVALVATALVATNPLLVWYSTEARAYALLALLSTVSLLAFARVLRRGSRRDLAFWAAACCLSLTTHYFAVFIVAAEAAVLAVRGRSRRNLTVALVPVVAIAVLLAPLAYLQRGHTLWIAQIPLTTRLSEIGVGLVAGVSARDRLLEYAAFGLAVAAASSVVWAGRRARAAARVWLAVAALALALPLVAALVGEDYLLTRNVIAVAIPWLFVVAVGCGADRAGWLGLAVATALSAVSLALVAAIASDERLQRVDWHQAAHLVSGHGRRVILAWGDYRLSPLFDYLGRPRRLQPRGSVRLEELDLLGFDRPRGDTSCWAGSACNMVDVELHGRLALPPFRLVAERRQGLFVVDRYRSTGVVRLSWGRILTAVAAFGTPYAWVERAPSGS